MEGKELETALEGVLFASGEPLSAQRLCLGLETDQAGLEEAAASLEKRLAGEGRGIRLVRLEDSWQLCSAPELAPRIRAILEWKPPKLSRASLETLAVVAYHQPVTRAFVDQVRGVDSAHTMGLLLERGLLEEAGKLDVPGHPALFRTTSDFLRTFGLSSLEELPPLPDQGEIIARRAAERREEDGA